MKTQTWVHLTPISSNAKTGPIPVSTSTSKTCPPTCPFKDSGCYAGSGPLALHWSAVTRQLRGMPWDSFLDAVRDMPEGQLWRHNQAGDLPGEGESINGIELGGLIMANAGKRGFTYTHKHSGADNLEKIRMANDGGFTVNLSANTLAHADTLADTKAGPVVVVLASDQNANTVTPAGRKVVVCPATQRDGVTCASCKLCSRSDRSVIIGFPAHGTGKRKASAVAVG
jgi:hypothetical protein